MSNTGSYRVIKGKVVKVSDRIPILKKVPGWAGQMDPEGEQRRVFNDMTPQQMRQYEESI